MHICICLALGSYFQSCLPVIIEFEQGLKTMTDLECSCFAHVHLSVSWSPVGKYGCLFESSS